MGADAERTRDIAALCRVEALLDAHPYDLSGGEQQRGALAKVLLTGPKLLLLDEPTKGMDSTFKAEFAALLRELTRRGTTVVLVSHDIEFCAEHADLVGMLFDGGLLTQDIPTRGIREITIADVAAAEKLGCVIKLIAWMKRGGDGSVAAGVEPCLVPRSNQLAGVDDVFNAVLVKGDMLGDVIFYGKGAGKLPTASAVVADVVDAIKEGSKVHDSLFWQPAEPVEGMLTDPAPAAYYVRVAGIAPAVVEAIYGTGKVVEERFDGCSYFVEKADARALAEAARKVEAVGGSVKLLLKRLPEEA